MKFAIVSDIHANLEALTTVLHDIEKRGIDTIYCLGDVVGYGASLQRQIPGEWRINLLGRHLRFVVLNIYSTITFL